MREGVRRNCKAAPPQPPREHVVLEPGPERPRGPSVWDCPHLGNNIGESVKTINCGCGNRTALYECEKFWQDCAPYVTNKNGSVENNAAGEVVLLCRDCEFNPVNSPNP